MRSSGSISFAFTAAFLLVVLAGCDSSSAPSQPPAETNPQATLTDTTQEMYASVCDIGMAYQKAAKTLGRPPVSLAELELYLASKRSLTSVRDGKPFMIGVVANVDVGGPLDRLIVWEATADTHGERYVFQESQGGYRVGEQEFQALQNGTWTRERWLPRQPLFPPAKS